MNPPSISPRVQDNMDVTKNRVEGVLAEFLTPVLPNIDGETTR